MDSQKKMGHFVGWQFGVEVTVHSKVSGNIITGRLIEETEDGFKVTKKSGYTIAYNKSGYYYDLVPYKYGDVMSPRYPVCVSPNRTAFCNSECQMTNLDTVAKPFYRYPTAKLVLADGTVIELSGETTDTLRQQLGR